MAERKVGKKPPLKRRVVFVAKIDGAREVVLTGDFTGWAKDRIKLAAGPDGTWQAMLDLPPGEYEYRLIVDGEWRDHDTASRRVPNPFGTQNCVLTVG